MSNNRIWILSGVLVIAVVALLGWFLGVKPQLDAANEADSQASSARQQLQLSRVQLASLKKQFDGIDALKTQLAALQQSVPGQSELSDFVRELSDESAAAGVTVTSETIGAATPITVPTTAPTPKGPSAPTPTSTLDTHAKLPDGAFFSLPVTIQASGTSDQLTDFVDRLQSSGQRLLLVSSVVTSAQNGANTATVGGLIYVLTAGGTPTPEPTPSN